MQGAMLPTSHSLSHSSLMTVPMATVSGGCYYDTILYTKSWNCYNG